MNPHNTAQPPPPPSPLPPAESGEVHTMLSQRY